LFGRNDLMAPLQRPFHAARFKGAMSYLRPKMINSGHGQESSKQSGLPPDPAVPEPQ
jgi:hypothetical protein